MLTQSVLAVEVEGVTVFAVVDQLAPSIVAVVAVAGYVSEGPAFAFVEGVGGDGGRVESGSAAPPSAATSPAPRAWL